MHPARCQDLWLRDWIWSSWASIFWIRTAICWNWLWNGKIIFKSSSVMVFAFILDDSLRRERWGNLHLYENLQGLEIPRAQICSMYQAWYGGWLPDREPWVAKKILKVLISWLRRIPVGYFRTFLLSRTDRLCAVRFVEYLGRGKLFQHILVLFLIFSHLLS